MKAALVGHVSRDATAIEGREMSAQPGEKKGSLFKSQGRQTAEEMLAALPQYCEVGRKKGAKGHGTAWLGCIDVRGIVEVGSNWYGLGEDNGGMEQSCAKPRIGCPTGCSGMNRP